MGTLKTLPLVLRLAMQYLPVNPLMHNNNQREPSNETLRRVWQKARNRERYNAWELKYFRAHNRYPKPSAYRFDDQRHSNLGVVKFQRHKRQAIGASRQTGPVAP